MREKISISFWVCALFLCTMPAKAQVGTCGIAIAESFLDVGNVRASAYNNGGLFWRGGSAVYEIPKGGGESALFNANLWVGGMVNDTLRVSGSRYGPWEMWAGPLDSAGNPPVDCSVYDRIWKISREDIESYQTTNSPRTDLAEWPFDLGAPVLDGDGVQGNYNLDGGDLPELLGDQRMWWVMNDRGNEHAVTKTPPIGIEVRGSAFGFGESSPNTNHSFYSYEIINRNDREIKDTYVGLFVDVDLGNFDDDYIGSDSLLNMGYGYNADNTDEGGYDGAPPAVGVMMIETILADNDGKDNNNDGQIDEAGEKLGVLSVKSDYNGSPMSRLDEGQNLYRILRGVWPDGSLHLKGGIGYDTNEWPVNLPQTPTLFSFSGDPVAALFWSERNTDDMGRPSTPGDRKMMMSMGPIDMAPGDTVAFRFAILWARGQNNLDSVTQLKAEAERVKRVSDEIYDSDISTVATESEEVFHSPDMDVYPNPFSSATTFSYHLNKPARVHLVVYDVLGREVEVLLNAHQKAGKHIHEFKTDHLPAGLYLARLQLDGLSFTKRLVLAR